LLLYQLKDGYCYNSDTHVLFYFIKESLKKYKNVSGNLLDIGSGSGILGLMVARDYEKLSLHQSEIQEEFQYLSSKNSEVNSIESNIYRGDFRDLSYENKFDIVVSNPPFYHSAVIKSENSSKKIARYCDSLPLEDFIKGVSNVLSNKGKFFFCYEARQLSKIVETLKKYNLNLESMMFAHPKSNKNANLVLIQAKKNSNSMLEVLPPITLFDGDSFSQKMLDIYSMCDTYSIKVESIE
jgi:tRNA1Val (adenine37-N6)-methyltransferase